MNPSKDQPFLDKLADHLRAQQGGGTSDPQTNGHARAAKVPPTSAGPSDEEVIEKCRAAKNGAKFSDLYDHGDVHAHHGGDYSTADLALLGMLAFWSQDATQLERLFSSSALGRRSKWRDRFDYRRRTIARALRDPGEVYDWNKNGGTAALPIRGSAASAAAGTAGEDSTEPALNLVRVLRTSGADHAGVHRPGSAPSLPSDDALRLGRYGKEPARGPARDERGRRPGEVPRPDRSGTRCGPLH